MTTRHTRGGVTWIDLEGATEEESEAVRREFDLDPRIGNEITSPTPYPAFAAFGKAAFVVLHFPAPRSRGGLKDQEIDIIVGRDFLITAHYEVVDSLHKLNKDFETEELLGVGGEAKADALLELVLYRLYGSVRSEVARAAGTLVRIEREIARGDEALMVRPIAEVGREFLHFENLLTREEQPLETFLETLALPGFFGSGFCVREKRILAERARISHLVSTYRATATELRENNMALLTAAQNEIMKTLTIMAFITLPLTLVAALFQMNMRDTPIIGEPYDFWIVIGIMLLLSGLLALFVVRKRWL
ncbi:MAG: CorA family divalent cation transporter [bacterium]